MALNENHQTEIAKFLAYFHRKRTELEKELESMSSEFIYSELNEDLYNKDDVVCIHAGGRPPQEAGRESPVACVG